MTLQYLDTYWRLKKIAHLNPSESEGALYPIRPWGGVGGGGWAGQCPLRFQLLRTSLIFTVNNTYQMWRLLLKCIGEQDSVKKFVSRLSIVSLAASFSTPCLLKF